MSNDEYFYVGRDIEGSARFFAEKPDWHADHFSSVEGDGCLINIDWLGFEIQPGECVAVRLAKVESTEIKWEEQLVEYGNAIWQGSSGIADPEGAVLSWRLCQCVRYGSAAWYPRHDCGLPCDCDQWWHYLGEAQAAVQLLHNQMTRDRKAKGAT